MNHLLMVVLDDVVRMPELLQSWRSIGVPGATLLKSAGAFRTSSWLGKVGLGGLERIFESGEIKRQTLFTVLDDEDLLARAMAEAERVVGGFDRPESGIMLVLPVSQTRGTEKVRPIAQADVLPPAVRPEWKTLRDCPIEEVDAILDLKPVIVRSDVPLDEVARAMLESPNVHVACVVADDGRLIGLLDLKALADDLFFHILPEEFLSEITDIEKVMDFADKTRIRTAVDAMGPAVWVRKDETVKQAFKRMHENSLPGLPVVDDRYQIIGYVNLLELLGICLEHSPDAEADCGETSS